MRNMEEKDQKQKCQEMFYSEDYIDFIYVGVGNEYPQELCTKLVGGEVYISHIPRTEDFNMELVQPEVLGRVPSLYGFSKIEGQGSYGSEALKKQLTQPAVSQLTGENIIIGILSDGIDYTHEAFRDKDNKTKILSIWDQTIPRKDPLPDYGYGTEFTEGQINEALASKDPQAVVPYNEVSNYGTYMAGLAAGYDHAAQGFCPVAKEAKLVVVRVKEAKKYLKEFLLGKDISCYSEVDLAMGIKYLADKAKEFNMPMVLLLMPETWLGPHTSINGTPIQVVINYYSKVTGIIPVSTVGNEGDQSHHFAGFLKFTYGDEQDKPTQRVQLYIGNDESVAILNMRIRQPDLLSIKVTSPTGASTGKVIYKSDETQQIHFLKDKTEIYINFVSEHFYSSEKVIYIMIQKPIAGVWEIEAIGEVVIRGQYNIWSPTTSLGGKDIYFLKPTSTTTVVVPATVSGMMSIGAYDSRYESVIGVSSRGFTTDDKVKPDVVDIGVNVIGPVPGNTYASWGGATVSAAITAGKVALFLENAFNRQQLESTDFLVISSYLIAGADRNNNRTYPDPAWGYGAVNISQSIKKMDSNSS